jgi:alpha-N-arabinofuranosidase
MNHIKIDLERVISDIDRNIFGGYLENRVYGGIYYPDAPGADKDGLRSDIKAALEQMKMTNIRYGGNFFSGYHWRDGIGPRQERPARHDLAWNRTVSNHFGTNEFIQFCRKLNVEPYLCANCGDGDMREAADWVEYCNGTGDTALVKLRREHGFAAPHKVKYWGIGNEVDSPGQIGTKTSQEYARAYTEYSKVMKRVDPDIKLFASAVCSWEDFPLGPEFLYRSTEWVERAQLMLEQAGDRIDYMSIHRYAHLLNSDSFETFMAFAADLNDRLTAYEGLIRAVSLERGIRHNIGIAVDEWGMHRSSSDISRNVPVNIARDEWGVMHLPADEKNAHRRESGAIVSLLEDALVTALYLNAFIRHASSVRFTNFGPMVTSVAKNSSRLDSRVLLETVYYPFELYSRTCGQLALDVFCSGDTFSGSYRNHAYTGIRTLDVTATLDAGRKQLVVYVVNQNKDQALESTVSLADGEFTGNVKISIINGPDIKAENTEAKPHQVGVQETALKVSGRSFSLTFEPHSVTALVCAVS